MFISTDTLSTCLTVTASFSTHVSIHYMYVGKSVQLLSNALVLGMMSVNLTNNTWQWFNDCNISSVCVQYDFLLTIKSVSINKVHIFHWITYHSVPQEALRPVMKKNIYKKMIIYCALKDIFYVKCNAAWRTLFLLVF